MKINLFERNPGIMQEEKMNVAIIEKKKKMPFTQ